MPAHAQRVTNTSTHAHPQTLSRWVDARLLFLRLAPSLQGAAAPNTQALRTLTRPQRSRFIA